MKAIAITAAALGFAALATAPAEAGCLKGAIVGGIAGHFVGHGGLGAAAGCAYGVHRNREQRAFRRNDDLNMGRSAYPGTRY
jgi:hypothetical protein